MAILSNAPADTDAYAQLKRMIVEKGLLIRSRRFLVEPLLNALILGALAVLVILLADTWWVLFLAIPAAFLFGQMGFVAHEATHNQVLNHSKSNYVLSVALFNLLLGGSRGWWASKHNSHHAQPNRLGKDPDIEGGPIAIAPIQGDGVTGLSRMVMRKQGYVIWPLMLVSALQIHFQSAEFLAHRKARNLAAELLLLLVHYTLYMGGLIALMGTGKAVIFMVIHQCLLGFYLGAAFLPNHTGMATVEPSEEIDFLHRQVLTARNLRSNALIDYLFGGLNRQIEHHLFPVMPRRSLHEAASIVRDFCQERGISYHEAGVFASYREVFQHLTSVAFAIRSAESA